MDTKVALLIPALSATNSDVNFLRSLAYFIYSPICSSIFSVSGNNTIVFFGIIPSPYVNIIKHLYLLCQILFTLLKNISVTDPTEILYSMPITPLSYNE